jgi:acid phosphatase family membrane protein YuiD
LTVLNNPLVLSSFLAMVFAQVSKVTLLLLTERRWVPERVTETGGMPSSHSATVAALCTSSALSYGFESSAFAISLVIGLIVIYDATGVRRAAGRHAEILNELVEEFSHLFEEDRRPAALKTLLGHSYPQVFVGTGIGIAMAFIVRYIQAS